MPRSQLRNCLSPEEMKNGVGMLESGVFQRHIAGVLYVSQDVIFRMWNRHLTHRYPSNWHGGGRNMTTTRRRGRFCWFSLGVNGFITLRHWITNSGTELECAFLHKQWETDSMSSDWMQEYPLYAFRWQDNTRRTGQTLPEFTSDGLFVTGRQCYSLMSPDSVSILLIGVSWCGECPKRDLMIWMWQNMTVMARAQSWFGQA